MAPRGFGRDGFGRAKRGGEGDGARAGAGALAALRSLVLWLIRSRGFSAARMAEEPEIDGLTVSGGEPFAQARGLAGLLEEARRLSLSTLVFTGFTLRQLTSRRARDPFVADALDRIDVLVDGLYDHALNDSRGLRGSGNQVVHFLTDRLIAHRDSLELGERRTETRMSTAGLMRVGVPPLRLPLSGTLPQDGAL